ncbi:MAG: hypothetical protein HKL80_07780 [Acidimicrobiales bacterium]|nr:hypothetical protein [Acidimicrobiales bacterium]
MGVKPGLTFIVPIDVLRFKVFVRPNSRLEKVGGSHQGDLIVMVREKAVGGLATKAAAKALAESFGVKLSSVKVVWGNTSRTKLIEISGQKDDLEGRLIDLLGESGTLFDPE